MTSYLSLLNDKALLTTSKYCEDFRYTILLQYCKQLQTYDLILYQYTKVVPENIGAFAYLYHDNILDDLIYIWKKVYDMHNHVDQKRFVPHYTLKVYSKSNIQAILINIEIN